MCGLGITWGLMFNWSLVSTWNLFVNWEPDVRLVPDVHLETGVQLGTTIPLRQRQSGHCSRHEALEAALGTDAAAIAQAPLHQVVPQAAGGFQIRCWNWGPGASPHPAASGKRAVPENVALTTAPGLGQPAGLLLKGKGHVGHQPLPPDIRKGAERRLPAGKATTEPASQWHPELQELSPSLCVFCAMPMVGNIRPQLNTLTPSGHEAPGEYPAPTVDIRPHVDSSPQDEGRCMGTYPLQVDIRPERTQRPQENIRPQVDTGLMVDIGRKAPG
ncbi:uncharacterized protein [Macaca nemestrina]|uniref:uncharacterized protein n=1 Tax=Macaca nemestrina TaxID=9545 RepID=UPI0039B97D58